MGCLCEGDVLARHFADTSHCRDLRRPVNLEFANITHSGIGIDPGSAPGPRKIGTRSPSSADCWPDESQC